MLCLLYTLSLCFISCVQCPFNSLLCSRFPICVVDQCLHFGSNILLSYFLFEISNVMQKSVHHYFLLLAPSIKFIRFVFLCLPDYLYLLDCHFLEDSKLSHFLFHRDTHVEPGLFHTYQLAPATWVFQPVGEYFNFKIVAWGLHLVKNV